jgi:hypothetical protein
MASRMPRAGHPALLTLLGTLWLLAAGGAEAATLHVASNGTDSSACGPVADPCRSISRAIANASPGSRIVVAAGRYGDLDNDGILNNSPGEEAAPAGCTCAILVDKRLTIESRDGAGATVLDAGGSTVLAVVRITAASTTFGKAKKGFRVTRGATGVRVEAAGVKVVGNHAEGNTFGFSTGAGTNIRVEQNLATRNSFGFAAGSSGTVLKGNVAAGNSVAGFRLTSGPVELLDNAAVENPVGFLVFAGTDHVLKGNTAAGNITGIALSKVDPIGTTATITRNNLYGNSGGCGIHNSGGNLVNAPNNFWGHPGGAGTDPADQVCNSGAGSVTLTDPPATSEFTVKAVKPL